MAIKLVFLVIALLYTVKAFENPIVQTKTGKVEGKIKISKIGKKVEVWNSIPFAKPPLNELRFLPPQPIDNWDGVLDTRPLPNACFQKDDQAMEGWKLNVPVSEDCLYLTVVTPHPRPKNAAIMFWLYGGAFYIGSSTLELYDYSTFSSVTDVIVVAPQYRLGPFGFLATENNEVIGNAGLRDQNLALKWIHDNIVNFGGDPSKITLMGESSGSASVGFHLMSPMSKSLFSQGIMESGVPTNLWAIQDKQKSSKSTIKLAENVGCLNHEDNMSKVIKCLQKIDPNEISKHSVGLNVTDSTIDVFLPTVDGEFITEEPHHFFSNHHNKMNKNILIGSTKEEGALILSSALPYSFPSKSKKSVISRVIFNLVTDLINRKYHESIVNLINYEYTPWENIDDNIGNLMGLTNMISDSYFTCDINEFADLIAWKSRKKVYKYLFSHHSSQSHLPEWTSATHADDLFYVFGAGFNPNGNYTEEEKVLSMQTMLYFGNFVKNG